MSDDALETYESNGITGRMLRDDDGSNPREWDNLACLTQLADRYSQPDSDSDPRVIEAWQRPTNRRSYGYSKGHLYGHDDALVERYARACLGAVAVGWWDDPTGESRVFAYVTREACEREGITDAQAVVDGELKNYADYVTGDVYGYTVTDDRTGEQLDSLWDMYGYTYTVGMMRASIQAEIELRHATRVATFRKMVDAR